jgi:hypothetical protein
MDLVQHVPHDVPEAPPGARLVPLRWSDGLSAIVDEDDFEFISSMVWHAIPRIKATGYVATQYLIGPYKKLKYAMHQVIVGIQPDGIDIDHRDGDGLNNRRANLRVCTRQQNMWNRRKRKGKSPFKGVQLEKGGKQIVACITLDGSRRRIGYFGSEIDAAHAYDEAARLHFGDFACVNFPRDGEQGALDASVLDAIQNGGGLETCRGPKGANP